MTRPNVIIRFFGSPPIALIVFALCALVVFDWYYGPLIWWEAIMAVGVAYRTARAANRMRHYRGFAKNWNTLRSEVTGDAPQPKPAGKSRRRFSAVLLLLILLPVIASEMKGNAGLATGLLIAWGCVVLYAGWLLLALVGRKAKRSSVAAKGRKAEAAVEAPVTWMLGRASGSPGRTEIQKALPPNIRRIMQVIPH